MQLHSQSYYLGLSLGNASIGRPYSCVLLGAISDFL